MKLSSDFVGTPIKEYRCKADPRWTMNYSAAIGETNPIYYNDELPGGIIAPPLFPVAVTWPMVQHITDNIEAADFPKEVIFTQVHYSEQLMIHRPVKAGDDITVRGVIAAILPHRAGTYVTLRFDAADAAGDPIFTEYIGAMMRGVECTGGGRGGESIPPVAEWKGGPEPLWESSVHISALTPYIYDGCSNIHFPIHTSVKFAHAVGLPGIILQGTATLAFAVREIVEKEAQGNSGRITSLYCRFTGMVLPGGDITVSLAGKTSQQDGVNLFFNVFNSEGKRVISSGSISLRV
jgi:acyl dehydratase